MLDVYLCRGTGVEREGLQELAIASLGVAGKFGQGLGVRVDSGVFCVERIRGLEVELLKCLGFYLRPPNYSQLATTLIS